MDNELKDFLEKIVHNMGTMNDKLDTLTQQTESNTKKLENVQSEVTKINIKIENNIEPNIKLIAEGHQPLSQIAKDVEHIKREQEEIKNNVDALMKVVPEHGAKIEELKKRA